MSKCYSCKYEVKPKKLRNLQDRPTCKPCRKGIKAAKSKLKTWGWL